MRLGSLCSGAGGLDMAVEQVFGATPAWHCEHDAAASKVLAHRYPGVPNYGDLINTDWAAVAPVDIVCAGWPCQPFSLAGKQKGAADERAIWPHIARAVRILRPRFVVLENVSAVLRSEFSRVADSLAALGYDLSWTCLRASDVGAPHRRERLFVVAYADEQGPQGTQPAARRDLSIRRSDADTQGDGRHEGRTQSTGLVGGSDAAKRSHGPVDLLPTPRAGDGVRGSEAVVGGVRASGAARSVDLNTVTALLPTPAAADGARGQDYARANRQGSGGDDLVTAMVKAALLPTPAASDGAGGKTSRSGDRIDEPLLGGIARDFDGQWGKYGPAIARWENVTRPAPAPTEPNRNGNPRLAPAFSEWMLGWPAGWVTHVPGISRNDALRIIGNGVCPQQAHAALTYLLSLAVPEVVA